jgi:hypothetical protein
MKKLTFIEALKVNETRRVIQADVHESRIGYDFNAGEMIQSTIPIKTLANYKWTTETEKFEFECEWRKHEGTTIISPMGAGSGFFNEHLQKFVGKRTKVTVEVIENE